MYILSIHIHPQYSRDLRAHARRPLRMSTSSQSSENTPKTACRRLLRQAARAQAQERERVDACTHTQARPTRRGLQAPHRRQVLLERRRQQPPVVEAELHLLHVDELLQPPVAPQRAALAVGWRGERVRLRRRVPEASASSDGLPNPAPSAVPFPSSLSAATQAHPAWSLSRGSDERPCVPRR